MSKQNADKNPAQNIGQTPEDESQLQRMGNQPAMTIGKPTNEMNTYRTIIPRVINPANVVDYALLRPIIEPQLDTYRAMYLQQLYIQLRGDKEEFARHLRCVVGDPMLNMAVWTLQQGQIMKNTYNQPAQLTANPNSLPMVNKAQKPQSSKHQSDSHEVHKSSNVKAKQVRDQPISVQGLGKQHQQQHMPFPRSSVANMNMSSQSVKQQTCDFTSSLGLQQNSGLWQPSMHKDQMSDQHHRYQTTVPKGPSVGQFESSKEEASKIMSSRPSFLTSMNTQEPMSVTTQLERQNVSAGNFSLASGSNAEIPPKKSTVGQKKPLEAPVSSLSKKQKVAGAFSDQSIEQLNDVTAVSGVNLREEKEQLFSGSKEDSRVSEASCDISQPSRPQEDPSLQQADQHSVHMSQAISMENADKNPAHIIGQTPEDESQLQRMQKMGNQQGQSAGSSSLASGNNANTLKNKPTAGQEKPSEALVSSRSMKQKVSGSFSDQSIEQLNDTTSVSGVSHRLVDDDGDVELLGSKQKRCESNENVSPMSDSVEKLSLPQSDIVCVLGYKMKRSTATTLEAIFKKHGDIAANCIFKTLSTRTHLLEAICEVVRQIQTEGITEIGEDIESQLSDAETANINVSWIRAHFEAINKSKETSEGLRLLMRMKENAILIKEVAQMDLRKRYLELMAAQKQFKVAERRVRVLHLVEKNLNDRILESKSKIDSWVKHSLV